MDVRGTLVQNSFSGSRTAARLVSAEFLFQFVIVFLAYFAAGKLGQATSNIRSSNIGPVWPAYGVALAALLAYGPRVAPAVALSALAVAAASSVSMHTAAGQAAGATLAATTGAFLLRRIPDFDPALSRLRDALGLIVVGAFGSALVSSFIGVWSLYFTGVQAYSSLPSAWLIYWLGDATGVLLVTPIVFTLPDLLRILSRRGAIELIALLTLLTLTCFVVFGDWPMFPVHLHVLAFVVLPFVMWGAINFGIAGAAISVFWIASIATVLTALGHGPFSNDTMFINAVMLDVFFTALSLSGLSLAAVIAERERVQEAHGTREALSQVNRRLIEAQEQERTRIARELHDDISQRLALLVSEFSQDALGTPAVAARLQAETTQIAADVQALSHRLHSSKLDLLGIAKTSRIFCDEFAAQQKVAIMFDEVDIPSKVPPPVSMCLYRILQESLHNAAKHSGAPAVAVHLRGTEQEIHLIVEDAGAGFDVEAAKASRGIGLVSMQERVSLVGGHLSVESAPNRGTTIHARVPFVF